MCAKKTADQSQRLSPVRIAPLGELNAYTVHEHELDIIAVGSPSTLAFNVAIALISSGFSFVLTLTTTTIASDRLFYGYWIFAIHSLTIGIIALIYWLTTRTSVRTTVAKIKSRMIVDAIQEVSSNE